MQVISNIYTYIYIYPNRANDRVVFFTTPPRKIEKFIKAS